MIRNSLVVIVLPLILVASHAGCKQGNSSSEAAEPEKPIPEGWIKHENDLRYYTCWMPGQKIQSDDKMAYYSSKELGISGHVYIHTTFNPKYEYVYPRKKPVIDGGLNKLKSETTGQKVDWCGLEAIEIEGELSGTNFEGKSIVKRKCDLGASVVFANLIGDPEKLTSEVRKTFFDSFDFSFKKQIVVDRPDMTEADKDWKDRLFGITELGTEYRLIKETKLATPNLNDRMVVHLEVQLRQVKDSFAEKDFARIVESRALPADLGVPGTFDPQLEKFLREPLSKTPEGGIVEIFIPESLTKGHHLIDGEFVRLKVKLIKIISD